MICRCGEFFLDTYTKEVRELPIIFRILCWWYGLYKTSTVDISKCPNFRWFENHDYIVYL